MDENLLAADIDGDCDLPNLNENKSKSQSSALKRDLTSENLHTPPKRTLKTTSIAENMRLNQIKKLVEYKKTIMKSTTTSYFNNKHYIKSNQCINIFKKKTIS